SYAHALDQRLTVPGHGEVAVDLAFGGNFYAVLEAEQLKLSLDRSSTAELIGVGRDVMTAVNEQLPLAHPESGYAGCEHTVLLAPGSDARRARHALVNHPGWMDRSPGGTGTSALMALHHARGDLELSSDFVN